jgi:hypothetical protein
MSTELNLGIYTGSITRGLDSSGSEVSRLYEAIDAAALNGEPFTIIRYGRRLTVTLEDTPGCKPCREGRHDDCLNDVAGGSPSCGCDQLTVHRTILQQRVYAARIARRPT